MGRREGQDRDNAGGSHWVWDGDRTGPLWGEPQEPPGGWDEDSYGDRDRETSPWGWDWGSQWGQHRDSCGDGTEPSVRVRWGRRGGGCPGEPHGEGTENAKGDQLWEGVGTSVGTALKREGDKMGSPMRTGLGSG